MDRIGGGGNGDVYHCTGTDGAEAAIKVLKRDRRRRRDRIARFRNEVHFLLSQTDRRGVLPLLDHALPHDPDGASWYVMPVAVPLVAALGTAPELPQVVEAVGHIARTLADLAAEGVSHRDIKPENLFKLDGEWVIGDFGLVEYPEQEAVTRHGQPLGPYYFMAPEMRRGADTADAELADVYSLAKTLWAIAAHSDPPPGQLRRDTPMLQLSAHIEHSRAKLLEPLLERCTADAPRERPRLRELAEELSWWVEPTVSTQANLSGYATEVQRLRSATRVVKKETEQERLERLYNEAFQRVQLDLVGHFSGAMEQASLVQIGFETRTLDGWPPENYGGGSDLSRWGIETLSSPWLATSIGVVHRAQPEADLKDLAVTIVLAMMTPDSQHNYIQEFKPFRPESFQLDHIIDELRARFDRELSDIIAHFLTNCGQIGIPK
jgi:hypothetical protein